MDSDDEFMVDELSDPEEDQDEDGFELDEEVESAASTSGGEPSAKRHMKEEDEFSYDCLTPESIVITMHKCIDEVNSVFEVRAYINSSIFMIITFTSVDAFFFHLTFCVPYVRIKGVILGSVKK